MDIPRDIDCLNPTIPWQQSQALDELHLKSGICMSLCFYFCYHYLLTTKDITAFIQRYFIAINSQEKRQLVSINNAYDVIFSQSSDQSFSNEINQFFDLYGVNGRIRISNVQNVSQFNDITVNAILDSLIKENVYLLGYNISTAKGHAVAFALNTADGNIWFFDPSNGFFQIPLHLNTFRNFLNEYLHLLSVKSCEVACLSL